jgi:hypothetical protein
MLLLSALFLSATLAAHADNIVTFDASGVFQSGSTLSGTLTLDSTTGIFTAVDLFVSSPDTLAFNAVAQLCSYPVAGICTIQSGNGSAYQPPVLVLDVIATSLIGYTGGSIGSETSPDFGYSSNIYFGAGIPDDSLTSGRLTTTPEPSSIALLGTGLLALGGFARRRLA